ncbi:hypothetical protein K435DRAFT_794376 [Dendrothele bispora CBS 962.96]|uniref:Uncharacterized protein n=1 Tax=Dendrothele bispora (strain CBS 962.96) TaxID=1314807 RepID=A0A4S8MCA5_DENBC|nr:hypothetical protein K435DRAFT_794376 [Dendrothele bispora CBS 962.96]
MTRLSEPLNQFAQRKKAVFLHGHVGGAADVGLFDAYDLIEELVEPVAATIFTLTLFFFWKGLCQTEKGSFVVRFLTLNVSKSYSNTLHKIIIFRHLLTRLVVLISSMTIAVAPGQPEIDALLVTSQVILSYQKSIMCVKVPASSVNPRARSGTTTHDDLGGLIVATLPVCGGNKWFGDHERKDREEEELESQPCWIIESIAYCEKATLEDRPLLDYLYYRLCLLGCNVNPVSNIKRSGSVSIVNAHDLPSARLVPGMMPSSANAKNGTRLHISQIISRSKRENQYTNLTYTHLSCTILVTGSSEREPVSGGLVVPGERVCGRIDAYDLIKELVGPSMSFIRI